MAKAIWNGVLLAEREEAIIVAGRDYVAFWRSLKVED